jgi:ABC-type multidrug transport system ATPase subunit
MTIKVSNLGKRFNREWIFRGLTAEFNPHCIYAITGPNGSGKSTLMQVLWGQVPASEGSIMYELGGSPVPDEDVFRHVAIAAPYMDLIEDFTLEEHIRFHFKFKKTAEGRTCDEVIKHMQLEEAAHKRIGQFSSGMKQRVKLGLAFFSGGEVLFLDEPSTNLDSDSIRWYNEKISETKGKKLVFIATNQSSDYPEGTSAINLTELKKVTNRIKIGIEPQ